MTIKARIPGCPFFFDFPRNPADRKETITRRIVSIATRSIFSPRHTPVFPSGNLANCKCFSIGTLYSQARPILPRKRADIKSIRAFREEILNFVPVKGEAFRLPEIDQKKPEFSLYERIAHKAENHEKMVFGDFSKLQKIPRIKPWNSFSERLLEPGLDFKFLFIDQHKTSIEEPSLSSWNFPNAAICLNQAGNRAEAKFNETEFQFSRLFSYKPDLNFTLFAPGEKVFCIADENEEAPVEETFFHSLIKSYQHLKPFAAPPATMTGNFETRHEIGRNLILEAKTRVEPMCRELNPRQIEREKVHHFARSSFSPEFDNKISSAEENVVNFRLELPVSHQKKISFTNTPAQITNSADNIQALPDQRQFSALRPLSRPLTQRLRLKLKRAGFRQRLLEMHLLKTYCPETSCKPEKILKSPASRSDFQISTHGLQAGFSSKYLKKIFCKARFALKKPDFRFLTRSQARFCQTLLKKISRPSLPCLPALVPLIRQTWRGRVAEKSKTASSFKVPVRLGEDFVQLLGRPGSFYMSLTRLDFTNISLPENRRRLKSPLGKFSISCAEYSSQFGDTGLNFLNLPEEVKKRFSERVARRTRLASQPRNLDLKPEAAVPVKIKQRIELSNRAVSPKKFACTAAIEDSLIIRNGMPTSICDELPLAMLALPGKVEERIAQNHIVPPPDWQFKSRPFICRLRLLPYPFGFPELSPPDFSLHPVLTAFKPAVRQLPTPSIRASGYNFQLSYRSFRSRFSLKDPQQWLFPEFPGKTHRALKIEFRQAAYPVEQLLNQLAKPDAFIFSWLENEYEKFNIDWPGISGTTTTSLNRFPFPGQPVRLDFQPEKIEEFQPSLCQIRRMLVRHYYPVCHDSIPMPWRISARKISVPITRFSDTGAKLADKFCLVQHDAFSDLRQPEVFAFFFQFSMAASGIRNFNTAYRGLFRQFLFPYCPEAGNFSLLNHNFFEIDDTSSIVNFAPGEEIRTGQIISEAFSLNSLEKIEFRQTQNYHPMKRFKQFFEYYYPEMLPRFFQRAISASKPQLTHLLWILNFPEKFGIRPRTSSTADFFAPSVIRPSPASFAGKKTETSTEPFSASWQKKTFSPKLCTDSPHWIILLKSFIGVTTGELSAKTLSTTISGHDFPVFAQPALRLNPADLSASTGLNFNFHQPCSPEFLGHSISPTSRTRIISSAFSSPASKSATNDKARFTFTGPALKNPEFNSKTEDIQAMSVPAQSPAGLKSQKSATINFIDFKMQGKIFRLPPTNKVKSKKFRPAKMGLNLPCTPDWLEMEMQHVDLGLQSN
ncbi:MAG: hypothetical protein ACOYXC_12705 [Candidatus Rifleibacteriota bacterium]